MVKLPPLERYVAIGASVTGVGAQQLVAELYGTYS